MKRFVGSALLILAFGAHPASAATHYEQAESFVASHDIGFAAIRSNLSVLEGLDYPGEWTAYEISVPVYGTYSVRMRCWGEISAPYHLHLVTYPVEGEEVQTIDIDFTGLGDDCT